MGVSELLSLGTAMAGFVGISLAHLFAVARVANAARVALPGLPRARQRRATDCPACGAPL